MWMDVFIVNRCRFRRLSERCLEVALVGHVLVRLAAKMNALTAWISCVGTDPRAQWSCRSTNSGIGPHEHMARRSPARYAFSASVKRRDWSGLKVLSRGSHQWSCSPRLAA